MAGETVQYKRTVKGSVGAGMGALFNGSGRQFFILQHKDSSKYHKAGESQKLIVDQVELGRAKDCQVRFDDESWPIVSRRHAAIEKDQTGWKLVPLSLTNSTLVNGRPINKEWYLQNGDEIQLSVGGPRLGFIVPAGKQSLVSSIKLTERLNLFREQALRPYKTGITVLCCLLVLACCAGGYFVFEAKDELKKERLARVEVTDSLKNFIEIREEQSAQRIAELEKEIAERKANEIELKERDKKLWQAIAAAKKDVYAVFTLVTVKMGSETLELPASVGAGFLLNDGRFVTARHCVQPWAYDNDDVMKAYALAKVFDDVEMTTTIVARSSTDSFTLSSDDFICDSSMDVTYPFSIEGASGESIYLSGISAFPIVLPDGTKLGDQRMYGADWAYANVGKKGSLTLDSNMSKNLKAGQEVHVLGFPGSLGIADGDDLIEPIYNNMYVSRDGLNDSNCIMVSQGVAKGNSGGPVFVYADGKLKVVAVVSRKESATQAAGIYGVQLQQQQYDQLVPISNLKK